MKELFDKFNKDKYVCVDNSYPALTMGVFRDKYTESQIRIAYIDSKHYIYDNLLAYGLWTKCTSRGETASIEDVIIKHIKQQELIRNRNEVINSIL